MKVLFLSGSYNENGNTSHSIKYFLQGLKEVVEVTEERIINAPKFKPNSCYGCLACTKKEGIFCVQNDEMYELVKEIPTYDLVVYAFPIYYYSMPGTLKMMLDRQLPYFDWDSAALKPSLKDQFAKQTIVSLVNCAGADLEQCHTGSGPIKISAELYNQPYRELFITKCEDDGLIARNEEKQQRLIQFGKEVGQLLKK